MAPMLQELLLAVAYILAGMVAIGALELAIPLHARSRDHTAHITPNLALTFLTFATNAVLNTLVVGILTWLQSKRWGLLNQLTVTPLVALVSVLMAPAR
jgi:hypothetical protein